MRSERTILRRPGSRSSRPLQSRRSRVQVPSRFELRSRKPLQTHPLQPNIVPISPTDKFHVVIRMIDSNITMSIEVALPTHSIAQYPDRSPISRRRSNDFKAPTRLLPCYLSHCRRKCSLSSYLDPFSRPEHSLKRDAYSIPDTAIVHVRV